MPLELGIATLLTVMTTKTPHILKSFALLPLLAVIALTSCSIKKDPSKKSAVKTEVDSSIASTQSALDMFKDLNYQVDTFYTSNDREIDIVFIRHASLAINVDDYLIYIDPTTIFGDRYTCMPQADMILMTHPNKSHCDPKALSAISGEGTYALGNKQVNGVYPNSETFETFQICNVDSTFGNHKKPFKIYAVPAYISDNLPVLKDPRSRGGLGFVLDIDDLKIYISGNSEFHEDMNPGYAAEFTSINKNKTKKEFYKPFKDVDIAFLSIDKATMSPLEAVDAAHSLKPEIVYPYHFSNTDLTDFFKGLAKTPNIETRRRRMGTIPTY